MLGLGSEASAARNARALRVTLAHASANTPMPLQGKPLIDIVYPQSPGGSATSVTLMVAFEANGPATTYVIDYGTTRAYGASTRPTVVRTGSNDMMTFPVKISGLKPGTTYHFRLVAMNTDGRSTGSDVVSTTAQPYAAARGSAVQIKAPTVMHGLQPNSLIYISGNAVGPADELAAYVDNKKCASTYVSEANRQYGNGFDTLLTPTHVHGHFPTSKPVGFEVGGYYRINAWACAYLFNASSHATYAGASRSFLYVP